MSFTFPARRSVVTSRGGIVATSQPLAVQAGASILQKGGNAVDAAIAAAAALNVVEPFSTGIGGDAFALVYLGKEKRLAALNASGWSPRAATLEKVRSLGWEQMPLLGIHTVTVPGALAGWCALLDEYGTMPLSDVLAPAIGLAKNGFPVTEVIAHTWQKNAAKLRANADAARTYLLDGRAPEKGEVFRQPGLARTLGLIAAGGRDVFYKGELAAAILQCSKALGGWLEADDLADYRAQWVAPVKTSYRGYDVYECPPNGQGLVTLLALNILEGYDIASMRHGSAQHMHLLLEAIKLAFADARRYIADPALAEVPVAGLLSKDYAEKRRQLIRHEAMDAAPHGLPARGDTVYLAAADRYGNSVSFINSLFHAFGSGIVVGDTGIALQNRGSMFSLEPGHPNCIAPRKRPYHTIIPAMAFKDGGFWLTFGVMGGLMQPQGQVQVLLNIIDFKMDVQAALDAPRLRFIQGNECAFEPGISAAALRQMESRGHRIVAVEDPYLQEFGGGQAIMHPGGGVLIGGSDPRKDGCALGAE